MTVPIARVDRIDPGEFVRAFSSKNQPVVIEGLLEGCEARRTWTFEWFRERHGAQDIEVIQSASRRAEAGEVYEPRNLGEYLELALREPATPYYMSESRLFEQVPGLIADVPSPPHFPTNRRIDRRLWLGPAGTVSHYHKDNHLSFARIESLFMQVAGQKSFTLVSPAQDAEMYPDTGERTLENHYAYQSPVDREYPDFDRFPKYRDAILHEAIVSSGDCLYIPAGWWHYVRALTPCISVSNWWLESWMAELVGRLLLSPEPKAILDEYRETLTVSDIESFHGGPRSMAAALRMIGEARRDLLLLLFTPEARRLVGELAREAS